MRNKGGRFMRVRNSKTILLALLTAALLCAWASAGMVDYYYSGELDPESGLPLTEEWQAAAAESQDYSLDYG